jgi:hypothetical protein
MPNHFSYDKRRFSFASSLVPGIRWVTVRRVLTMFSLPFADI